MSENISDEFPQVHLNFERGERDLHATFPSDICVYDVMDSFVGVLLAAGYPQSHINHWIADKASQSKPAPVNENK